MILNLKVRIPSNVDESTLSHLLTAVNSGEGVTILTPKLVHLDVDLVNVERADTVTSQEVGT